MTGLLLSDVIFCGFTIVEVFVYSAAAASGFGTFLLSLLLYRVLRPRFPVRVNCWFCNKYVKIAYTAQGSWDCPHCEQYNGFKEDGDYNRDIISIKSKKFADSQWAVKDAPLPAAGNGLCRSCNLNQQLKIRQLASFTPMDDDNYDQEVDHFRAQLEKSYRLCSQCEFTLSKTLEKQRQDFQIEELVAPLQDNKFMWRPVWLSSWSERYTWHTALALRIISFCLLPLIVFAPIYTSNSHFTMIAGCSGMVALWMSQYLDPAPGGELCLCAWGIEQLACWLANPQFLVATTAITFYFHAHTLSSKLSGRRRRLRRSDNKTNNPFTAVDTPVRRPLPSQLQEDLLNKLTKEQEEPSSQPVPAVPDKVQTRSQTKMLNNPAQETKIDRSLRHLSPPPEIYDGINGLHLSSEQKPSRGKTTPFNIASFDKIEPEKPTWTGLLRPGRLNLTPKPSFDNRGTNITPPSRPSSVCSPAADVESRCSTPSSTKSFDKWNGALTRPNKILAIAPEHSQFSSPSYNPPMSGYPFTMPPMFSPTGQVYGKFSPPMGFGYGCDYSGMFPCGYPSYPSTTVYSYSQPWCPTPTSTPGIETNHDSWFWVKRLLFVSSLLFNICSITFLGCSYIYPWLAHT